GQHPTLHLFILHQVIDRRNCLLVRRRTGVEHVTFALLPLVLHGVEQDVVSSLNTGSTDLRDTEVQQPNTAATLFLLISSRAFSANNGQLEAGSTTTASSFLPSRPPFLFCSSINISITSFSVVSLMAMVPESEWRMPTLMVSCAWAGSAAARPSARTAVAASA